MRAAAGKIMSKQQLPSGHAAALRVFRRAIEEQIPLRRACNLLNVDPTAVSQTSAQMRELYLDGKIDTETYSAYMDARDKAARGMGKPPKSPTKKAQQAVAGKKTHKTAGPKPTAAETEEAAEEGFDTERSGSYRTKPGAQGPKKGRTEKAEFADKADADVNEEEDRARTWEERSPENLIVGYGFEIKRRDDLPLVGILSRSEMEKIHSTYPFATVNQLCSDFPAYDTSEMKRILRAFNITKDRKFPKHIIEEHSEEDVARFGLKAKEKASYKKLDLDKAGFFEKELRKSQQQVYDLRQERELIDKIANAVLERYVEEGRLKPAPPLAAFRPAPRTLLQAPPIGIYGDTHFGKFFETQRLMGKGRGTSKEILTQRLQQIAAESVDYIRRTGSPDFFLFNMGDILESMLPDGMHPQHALEMEFHGEEQLLAALEAHEDMFQHIVDNAHTDQLQIHFHGLGGNHDRIGAKREEDSRRTGAMLFYALLEKFLRYRMPGKVQVIKYPEGVISLPIGNLSFIGFHGDTQLAKVKAPELMNTFKRGNAENYTLMVNNHFHSMVMDEGHNYTRMTVGAVCSADDFVQNKLAKGAQPSFILGREAYKYGFDFQKVTLH